MPCPCVRSEALPIDSATKNLDAVFKHVHQREIKWSLQQNLLCIGINTCLRATKASGHHSATASRLASYYQSSVCAKMPFTR